MLNGSSLKREQNNIYDEPNKILRRKTPAKETESLYDMPGSNEKIPVPPPRASLNTLRPSDYEIPVPLNDKQRSHSLPLHRDPKSALPELPQKETESLYDMPMSHEKISLSSLKSSVNTPPPLPPRPSLKTLTPKGDYEIPTLNDQKRAKNSPLPARPSSDIGDHIYATIPSGMEGRPLPEIPTKQKSIYDKLSTFGSKIKNFIKHQQEPVYDKLTKRPPVSVKTIPKRPEIEI
jgi:hypothetical protein